MPALPGGLSRRNLVTTIVAPWKEAAWERSLDHLGLEPINKQDRPIPTIPAKIATMEERDSHNSGAEGRTKKLQDLPVEMLKKIFGFVSLCAFCVHL